MLVNHDIKGGHGYLWNSMGDVGVIVTETNGQMNVHIKEEGFASLLAGIQLGFLIHTI